LGYRTFGCPYGSDALVLLDQNPLIDLLFTDVVMPGGMGGRELANAARAQRPELKVLFTSGYTENSIDQNGRLDSDVEFLSKPYRRDQLAAKVRKVLDETH
jgi:CheY-like chemotaxis protein